jgi:hypothetical protein
MQNAPRKRAHYAKWQVCRSQRWRDFLERANLVFVEASPFRGVRNGDGNVEFRPGHRPVMMRNRHIFGSSPRETLSAEKHRRYEGGVEGRLAAE